MAGTIISPPIKSYNYEEFHHSSNHRSAVCRYRSDLLSEGNIHDIALRPRDRNDHLGVYRTGEQSRKREDKPFYQYRSRSIFLSVCSSILSDSNTSSLSSTTSIRPLGDSTVFITMTYENIFNFTFAQP